MFAKDVLADEEIEVDPQLGYPRGYAKLCRHAYTQMQGLITPYTEGPPQRFHPYAPQDEELAMLKGFDTLFPIVDETVRDPSSTRRHAGLLWQQLDHLGNAGFDPSKFRVDVYGNVLYWNADPGSLLAWEVDHWFPHSRGGKTVVSNLRIVQWQVNQRKSTKLEFLVPWWDLQMGVSVNQFLSVFSSKNIEYRQRAFALFFSNGENEQLDENLVVECHSWPQPFRERKHQVGLAAAAIVKVHKPIDDTLKAVNSNSAAIKQSLHQCGSGVTPGRRRWSLNEEEALKRALLKFGPGNWKEIKECEPMLANRSTVQIKDKYRIMKGEWQLDKENRDGPTDHYSALTTSIQKEERIKQLRAEETKLKENSLIQLEEELGQIKAQNENAKLVLEDLEQSLAKHRKRAEKQRKWAETQVQYRLCLEKMIRDTMHQCVLFKEQARLNQAACNSLLARLESHKLACDSAELDFIKRVKQRESLEALARPKITKRTRNEGHTDVNDCIKPRNGSKTDHKSCDPKSNNNDKHKVQGIHRLERIKEPDSPEEVSSSKSNVYVQDSGSLRSSDHRCKDPPRGEGHGETPDCSEIPFKEQDLILSTPNEDDATMSTDSSQAKEPELPEQQQEFDDCQSETGKNILSPTSSNESSGMKRKAPDVNDLDVVSLMHEYEETESGNGSNKETDNQNMLKPKTPTFSGSTKDEEQLDELVQEVSEMKGKVHAAMKDAIQDDEDDEHNVKHVGKFHLDGRLLRLLCHPSRAEKLAVERTPGDDPHVKPGVVESQDTGNHHLDARQSRFEEEDSNRGGTIAGFFKKLSFKQGPVDVDIASKDAASAMPHKAGFKAEEKGDKAGLKSEEKGESSIKRLTTHPWGRAYVKRATSVNAAFMRPIAKVAGESKEVKAEERKVIENFSRLRLDGDGRHHQVQDNGSTENCEEFVQKMKAVGEQEQSGRRLREGLNPRLRDLFGEPASQEHCEESPSASTAFPEPLISKGKVELLTSLPSPSPTNARFDEHRRRSTGAPANQHLEWQPQLVRNKHAYPQQSVQPQPTPPPKSDRSSSTPPGAQIQQAHTCRIAEGAMQPTGNMPRRLLRQQTTGHAVTMGGGGAARKASMLMKSASTRGSGSGGRSSFGSGGAGGTPARSNSSSNGGSSRGRGGEGEAEEGEEVGSMRRKATLFQDWDATNEGLRASLSHVWKKAVKKFDLAR